MKKYLLIALLIFTLIDFSSAQVNPEEQKYEVKEPEEPKPEAKKTEKPKTEVESTEESEVTPEFERPINIFAAAGAGYRFGKLYDVSISPIDYTVQFEEPNPILTRFSLGLVWNPLKGTNEGSKEQKFKKLFENHPLAADGYKIARNHLAVALLANVFNLGYTSGDFKSTSLIDMGLGAGYRNGNFLIIGTVEFTPFKTPKKFFVDSYKGQNKTIVLADGTDPLRTISTDDNSLFTNRIFISVGFKVAYAFAKDKEKTLTEKELQERIAKKK